MECDSSERDCGPIYLIFNKEYHRVCGVLSFFSSHRIGTPPPPHPQASVPPFGSGGGGGGTLACVRGGGGVPMPRRRHTLIHLCFVVIALCTGMESSFFLSSVFMNSWNSIPVCIAHGVVAI